MRFLGFMAYYINVILPIPLEKEFTYSITKAEASFLKPGMRVSVPFGKTKIYTALVVTIHQQAPEVYEPKEIENILDETPLVTSIQLQLWDWMASYYLCTRGEVLQAAFPGAFLLQSETIIVKNDKAVINEMALKDDEFLVYEALQYQSVLKIQELMGIVDRKNVLPILKRLLDKEVIIVQEKLYEQYKPKLISYIKFSEDYAGDEALREVLAQLDSAPKQKEVVLKLFALQAQSPKNIKKKELVAEAGTSSAVVKALLDKGILESYQLQTDRVQYNGAAPVASKVLNAAQQQAVVEIEEVFVQKSVCLLHGVTSSGKTEVYVKLIEKALAKGNQVLYLLPEIALTAQLLGRLQQYFGDQVAVYHSRYSANERVEVWHHVLRGSAKARLIVGARSAIFLPFQALGLIVVDEEHESTFKQFDPAPRYHARDTAIVLATFFKAKLLLGSATPSLESHYNTLQGKYGLVALTERFGKVMMPAIALVDIKTKYRKKLMKGHFSDTLLEAITEALQEKEQVILFQNRRGYAPITECVTCGHSPQCPNCDVSLTYHQYKNQLRCHYCGHTIAKLKVCRACGSTDLNNKGFGTEQIEDELKLLFPDHQIGRMDQDTTRGKHGHEKIITAFEQGALDILVGTQMLSKGLDFRKVSLVGVMNADSLLNFPDFRAHERCFQLLQQVAGRAGRTKKRGKVLIQTYDPYHQILQQVSINNYSGMAVDQLEERRQYKYPPFYRLIKFTFRHKDYNRVNDAAAWYGLSLRTIFKENVLGPEFPPISRIRNQYNKNVILKIPQQQSLSKTKMAIRKISKTFASIKDFSGVRIVINVDN